MTLTAAEKKINWLALLVPALVLLRLGIALTSVELVSHYDETDLGTIARELMNGLRVPFWYFQLDTYSGESFVLGPLVIPFFKAFGVNLFAIKMVPLLFSILTLCLIFYFCGRHFGPKAALYAGSLFVLAPPGLAQLSLCAMTGHSEAFFFGLAALTLVYEYLFCGRNKILLVLSGLVSGFAVWFYYANAMMVAAALVIFAVSERRGSFRALPLFAAGFAVGFSPWLALNLNNHFMGLELVGENLGGFDFYRLVHVLKKPAALLLLNIPGAIASIPVFILPASAYAYTYYALLLSALVRYSQKKGKHLIWLAYPAVYFVTLMASQFDPVRNIGFVGYRYVTPLLFMLLMAAGVWLSASRAGRTLFFALTLMGLTGQASLLFKEPFGRALAYAGTSYYQLGTRWHFNLYGAFTDYEDFQKQTAVFSPWERKMILWGIAQMSIITTEPGIFEPRPGPVRDLTVLNMAEKEPEDVRPISYEWLGAWSASKGEFREVLKSSKKYFCQGWLWSPRQAEAFMDCPDCYAGKETCDINQLELAALYFGNVDEPAWKNRFKSIAAFQPEERQRAYRGLGRAFFLFDAVLNPLYKKADLVEPQLPPAGGLTDFYWGVGWGIRERFREDRVRALDWAKRLPLEGREAAKQGIETFEEWYGIKN